MLCRTIVVLVAALATIADPPQPKAWLSQAESAAYLGVTTRTIRDYIARGLLPASRVRGSRLIRIRRSDLDAMLQAVPTTGGGRDASD